MARVTTGMPPSAGSGTWRDLGGRLSTTSEGVELGLLRAFVAIRAVNVLQATLAVLTLASQSPRPVLDIVLVVVFVAHSVRLTVLLLRSGTLRRARSVWTDVAVCCLLLLLQWAVTAPADRIGTWAGWGYALSVSSASLAGAALGRRRQWAAVAALSGSYLVGSAGGYVDSGTTWTALTNVLAYAAFAVVGDLASSYLRRLGADADLNRRRAERAAAEEERDKARSLLHDHVSLLTTLGRSDSGDVALRAQATAGANVVRAYMAGAAGLEEFTAESDRHLAGLLRGVAAGFPDLPLTLNVDLAEHVVLTPEQASTAASAVTTLLHNVRQHARATSCVVHADAPDAHDVEGAHVDWEVTVRDDGIGFDPAAVRPGYGLSRQVEAACQAIDVDVVVESRPTEGTTVVLTRSSHGRPAGGGDR